MTRGRTREEDMFLLNRVKELEADLERARAWITELEAGICEAVSKPYRLDEIAKRLTAQRADAA
jgi:BMFP domain-containing protein YqiC